MDSSGPNDSKNKNSHAEMIETMVNRYDSNHFAIVQWLTFKPHTSAHGMTIVVFAETLKHLASSY